MLVRRVTPSRALDPVTHVLDAFLIPSGAQRIGLHCTSENWPKEIHEGAARIMLEISDDAGVTWAERLSMNYTSGPNRKTGEQISGPSPYLQVDPPFARDTLGRWTIILTIPQTMGFTVEVE